MVVYLQRSHGRGSILDSAEFANSIRGFSGLNSTAMTFYEANQAKTSFMLARS
jgi:hypothetical protein